MPESPFLVRFIVIELLSISGSSILCRSQYFLKSGFEETTLSNTINAAGTTSDLKLRKTKERLASFTLFEYAFVMSPFK